MEDLDLASVASGPRRVLICIAHLVRDFEGCCLVGYLLERNFGFHVTYCRLGELERKLVDEAPDAVLLDYVGGVGRAEVARLAKRLNIRVVVLPVAGFYGRVEDYLDAAGRRTGAAGWVDCFLAWGDAARDILVGSGLYDESRVPAVGCPRFDFYHEPLRSLMDSRDDLVAAVGCPGDKRPLLVWATSTPEVARDRETLIAARAREGKISKEEVRRELDEQTEMFREQIHAIGELAGRNPGWLFVIKVHPRESAEPYRHLSDRFENVRVSPVMEIRAWLLACDVLVQRMSTTATEAWMLGKPVIELVLGRHSAEWAPEDYAHGNRVVRNAAEAEAAIAASLIGGGVSPAQVAARQAFLARHYHGSDGQAGERSAAEIAKLLSPPYYPESERRRTASLAAEEAQRWRKKEERRPVNRLKVLLGMPLESSLRFWRKRPRRASPEAVPLPAVKTLYSRLDGVPGWPRADGQNANKD